VDVHVDVDVDVFERQRASQTLAHERLDVYQRAIEFLATAVTILDACRILGVADDPAIDQGKRLLVRIVSMLSRMCR
jgi:hypothetical protein